MQSQGNPACPGYGPCGDRPAPSIVALAFFANSILLADNLLKGINSLSRREVMQTIVVRKESFLRPEI
jgi:hypothetical protein